MFVFIRGYLSIISKPNEPPTPHPEDGSKASIKLITVDGVLVKSKEPTPEKTSSISYFSQRVRRASKRSSL